MGIKPILLVFLLLFAFHAPAQLKKSYLGRYAGEIGSYEINTGQELFTVQPVDISVHITRDSLTLHIGHRSFTGTYAILLETHTYILLEALLHGQIAPERIVVYKKGKKISREGIKPQPDVVLKKQK
jgi:hypothetical protein